MNITCKNRDCNYNIEIADGTITGRSVAINCPECNTQNIISPPEEAQTVQTAGESGSPLDIESAKREIMANLDARLAQLRQELMGELAKTSQAKHSPTYETQMPPSVKGSKKALICDDDALIRNMIKDNLTDMGFITYEAVTVEEAITTLRDSGNGYDMVLIDKVFPKDEQGGYKILAQIASLPISVRRKIFVVFISANIKTSDHSAAFLMGANTLVNKEDLSSLKSILVEEMKEYDKLYSVFNDCLHIAAGGGRHIQ